MNKFPMFNFINNKDKNMRSALRFFSVLILIVVFTGLSLPAYAQTNNPPSGGGGPCTSTNTIGDCVVSIYRWSLGAGVLLALFMIIWAGYRYITAGGNAQAVTSAKEYFFAAFVGLIILFAAVVILRTINPDLAAPPPLPNI
ncbi:MAG TPA: TrbC/VirB2 family protein [Patescibacteria group bacterium]|nr:TrbC/VirB2 family protein [Patescibacteria group bacterium]